MTFIYSSFIIMNYGPWIMVWCSVQNCSWLKQPPLKRGMYCVLCLAVQSCPTLCDPMERRGWQATVHGDSPGKNTGVVAVSSSRGSSQPRDWTQVFRIAGRFFTIWATKNAGVGSLSLLQGIFPTEELNWGLLDCRQILYQLDYQGSPRRGLQFHLLFQRQWSTDILED